MASSSARHKTVHHLSQKAAAETYVADNGWIDSIAGLSESSSATALLRDPVNILLNISHFSSYPSMMIRIREQPLPYSSITAGQSARGSSQQTATVVHPTTEVHCFSLVQDKYYAAPKLAVNGHGGPAMSSEEHFRATLDQSLLQLQGEVGLALEIIDEGHQSLDEQIPHNLWTVQIVRSKIPNNPLTVCIRVHCRVLIE